MNLPLVLGAWLGLSVPVALVVGAALRAGSCEGRRPACVPASVPVHRPLPR